MANIEIQGTRELAAVLRSIPENEARRAIRRGTRAGQKIIARAAARLAPKRTGALALSIRVRAMKRRRSRVGTVVVTGKSLFEGETYYGGFQEFGWKTGRRRVASRTTSRRTIQGKHFMEGAARSKGKTAGFVAATVIRSELGIELRQSQLVKKAIGARLTNIVELPG